MAYTKTIWVNDVTDVTAERMNNLEKINDCLKFKGTATNLNILVDEGIYNVDTTTLNTPFTNVFGKCLMFKNPDNNAIVQAVFKTNGEGNDCLYLRNSYFKDGVKLWTPWQQTATNTKTSFNCTPASGFTITSQNCYKINNEIVFNVDVKRTNNLDITATTQMFFTLPYKPSAEFPVTTVARNSAYGLMNSFVQTIVNTNGQVWSLVGSACGYVSISGRFEI